MVETRSGRSVSPTPGGMRGRRRNGEAGGGSGELSDSQLYTLLALSLAGTALVCIMVPKTAARFAFGSAAEPPEDQHAHTLSLLGWGMAAAAAAAFALEECARKHMQHTFTADTLKLGLAVFAATDIALQFYYPRTMTALAAIAFMLSRGLAFALPATQLFVAAEDRNRLWRDFRRLPRTLPRAFSLRKPTMSGLLYLLLTVAFPVAGAAYFAAPKTTLFHTFGYAYGKSTYMTWKGVGGALMTILPAMTYTLKDKAENNLLGRSVARTLNIGLLLASVGHLLVFGPILNQGHGGWLLPILTATWGTALLASMAGLAAPEAAALLEQAEAEAAAVAPSE